MTVIRVEADSTLPPERVLHAAHDFSDQREDVFPAVSIKRMDVHEMGQTSADVTEGTRAGPIVNWERCRYDWSTPGRVIATVADSNVYATPGSKWEITATHNEGRRKPCRDDVDPRVQARTEGTFLRNALRARREPHLSRLRPDHDQEHGASRTHR
ncbi:MAG: hypothetical protein WBP81_20190 [Solirubrobacteraceae bacterium]